MTKKNAEPTVELSYRTLLAMSFWQKLAGASCQTKSGYWIRKLLDKVQSAQKKVGPEWKQFLRDQGEKYGERDPEGKVIMEGQFPVVQGEHQDAYQAEFQTFMDKVYPLDFRLLPLDTFGHLNFSPGEWETLEQVAFVDEEKLMEEEKSVKQAHEQLRALQGGQSMN